MLNYKSSESLLLVKFMYGPLKVSIKCPLQVENIKYPLYFKQEFSLATHCISLTICKANIIDFHLFLCLVGYNDEKACKIKLKMDISQ